MFIGHFAVALAAKKAASRPSLGTFFLAAQFLDLLWPVLLLAGWEHVVIEPGNTVVTPLNFTDYPISHSLLTAIGWAILAGGGYRVMSGNTRSAVFVGLVVVSHWVLDVITHRPDLPLYPGSTTLMGFGLWNSLSGTLLIEGGLFFTGVVVYLKATKARDGIGLFAFWGLMLFLVGIYMLNLFGPPPPDDPKAIAMAGLSMWLLVAWSYWVDRHRRTV